MPDLWKVQKFSSKLTRFRCPSLNINLKRHSALFRKGVMPCKFKLKLSLFFVSALQLEEGKLLVDGDIDGVQYEQGRARRRGGFLRRAIG